MIYKWKFQPKGNVSAQAAGDCIEQIAKKNRGAITAKAIVKEAKAKKSPLHNLFEWDDTVAAKNYREEQARQILVQLVIIQKGKNNKDLLKVRAFVSVEEERGIHYTPFERAMSKPHLREQLLLQAMGELQNWQQKYEDLKELSRIFAAIAEVAAEQQKKIKRRKAG